MSQDERRPGTCRVVVLASGSGTLLQALLDASVDPASGFAVSAVISDRADAPGLERARAAQVPTAVVALADFPDRAVWDVAIVRAIDVFAPDLVVCAGFMRILGPPFLQRYAGRAINTHPALLPAFPGAHGVRDALTYGVRVTGCTVMLVDEGTDAGPVIAQEAVLVQDEDDEASLHERIKVVERRLLVDVVGRMARNGWTVERRSVILGRDPGPSSRGKILNPSGEAFPDMSDRVVIRRALLSVYDKSGLEELAAALHTGGVAIVSTGSTAARVAAAGIPVTPVEELTGFPECLDGRVKTLHPRVHAGILADRRLPEHVKQLSDLDIEPFDLVVVNLYPFRATVASGAGRDECVEQIDIGGPSMVRAAAKNHPSVAVVVDPARYGEVAAAVAAGGFTLAQRQRLAAQAFAHTASYDIDVASWMGSVLAETDDGTGFPVWVGSSWERKAVLRYGENPHQRAALYRSGWGGLADAEQLHGREMSYNNYIDTDAAWRAAHDHGERACVAIIKHANPCGIAVGLDLAEAYRKALACDPVSAFGGVVATNGVLTLAVAEQIAEVFTEVVVAPGYDDDALALLTAKKNVRVLAMPPSSPSVAAGAEFRPISGGILLQTTDAVNAPGDDPASWTLAAGEPADDATLADLEFAWRAVRAVKSNAILLAREGASVGVGMGQVNRVDSCRLAVERAGADRARGAVAASDAFFPFADGLEVLIAAGVRAVVQPGGSMRDEEVIAAARAAGITMYLTGSRHFAH